MLSFLLDESILTAATISAVFTTTLLTSLKLNIIDPIAYKFINKLDIHDENDLSLGSTTSINWKTFIKDLIIWFIIVLIVYLVWKFVIREFKRLNINFNNLNNLNNVNIVK